MTSEPASKTVRAEPKVARRSRLAVVVLGPALALLIAGCGSSGSATASATALRRTCKQIEAALSDGPEPAADPVGYAEAQVRPLREIHASDAQLGHAIGRLASAYDAFYLTRGSKPAGHAVTAASRAVDAICPGAAG